MDFSFDTKHISDACILTLQGKILSEVHVEQLSKEVQLRHTGELQGLHN